MSSLTERKRPRRIALSAMTEESLDPVDARIIGWDVVKMPTRPGRQPRFHLGELVRAVIVDDDMQDELSHR
jgi:hypothetical protein